MALAEVYRKNNMKLPHRLQTMQSGVLPPAPLPPRIPYAKVKKEDRGKYCDALVNSQQMLLNNIRRLKDEVDQTNKEIRQARKERLYGDLLENEDKLEREPAFDSKYLLRSGDLLVEKVKSNFLK